MNTKDNYTVSTLFIVVGEAPKLEQERCILI
jgi:hypothetical protein